MKLSLLIPVYNESPWLHHFWDRLKKAPIDRCAGIQSVEIVLVDDGSQDGSREILAEMANEPFQFDCGTTATIQLVLHEQNRGKGSAIQTAINHSTGDIVLIQDADLEYSPDDYPALMNPFIKEGADAVFGSRFMGASRRVLLFWHMIGNRIFTLLSNGFSNLNLTDMECGYKAVRGALVRRMNLVSPRFGIEPELTAKLAHAKAKIFEVPVSYAGRSYAEGKKIGFKDAVAALFHILRFSLWDREPFRPGQAQTLSALDNANEAFYAPLLERALRLTANVGRRKILEVGCGTGGLTQHLLKWGEVTVTDIEEGFLDACQRKFKGHRNFKGASIYDVEKESSFPSASFDLVVAFNLLEHVRDDSFALSEWKRLLKPGGQLVCLVPAHPLLYGPIDKAIGHVRRYDAQGLEKTFQAAGFQICRRFNGNSLGIIGWWLNSFVLRKATLDKNMVSFYSHAKRLLTPIEKVLEPFVGLSFVVVAAREKA